MHHPFKIETFTRIGGSWHQDRSAHAATQTQATGIIRLRATKAQLRHKRTATVLYARAVNGWQAGGAAIVTRDNGSVVSVPTTSPEWQQMGIPETQ